MPKDDQKQEALENADNSADAKVVSRRSMLKGTLTAMPAVLTLHSGAALARSSNMVSATRHKTPDKFGRTLCLDKKSVMPARGHRSRNLYDMGEPAYARVTAINEREYRYAPDHGSTAYDETALCERGGKAFYYKDAKWQDVQVNKGMMVSATAMTSFAGNIVVTDI